MHACVVYNTYIKSHSKSINFLRRLETRGFTVFFFCVTFPVRFDMTPPALVPFSGFIPMNRLRTNERTNEMHLYSAFIVYCCTPKALYNHEGVSPQPPPVCSIHLDDATAATGQRCQCTHHTPATGGEERES